MLIRVIRGHKIATNYTNYTKEGLPVDAAKSLRRGRDLQSLGSELYPGKPVSRRKEGRSPTCMMALALMTGYTDRNDGALRCRESLSALEGQLKEQVPLIRGG